MVLQFLLFVDQFLKSPLDDSGFIVLNKLKKLLIKIYMDTWHCRGMKLYGYINMYTLNNICYRIGTFIYVYIYM